VEVLFLMNIVFIKEMFAECLKGNLGNVLKEKKGKFGKEKGKRKRKGESAFVRERW